MDNIDLPWKVMKMPIPQVAMGYLRSVRELYPNNRFLNPDLLKYSPKVEKVFVLRNIRQITVDPMIENLKSRPKTSCLIHRQI